MTIDEIICFDWNIIRISDRYSKKSNFQIQSSKNYFAIFMIL